MCGSYKLLCGLLNCDWAYFLGVLKSRGHCRLRPISRDSNPVIGADRGRQCCPKNGHFGPFSPASISIANRNWSHTLVQPALAQSTLMVKHGSRGRPGRALSSCRAALVPTWSNQVHFKQRMATCGILLFLW